ncbi:MAG: alkaline phosphatase family protein [Caldilineaceae bacterium]|nr:alkaline phosphatase family protein [Caldilineaceae bacterium]
MVRRLLLSLCLAAFAFGMGTPVFAQEEQPVVDTIAFGSCAEQDRQQLIWDAVLASQPDVFVFLGDNIYGDTEDMDELRAKYELLGAKEGYQRLQATTDVIAIWDDHDYGANDAGMEYPMKEESKQIFLDFFGEPEDSERRLRDGGIYTAYLYGPEGQRVQVILPDLRWDRTPVNTVSDAEYEELALIGAGPYTTTVGADVHMLGAEQWAWLEEQLRQPAELRIIGTSIPFLQDGTGWETWTNFPDERERLIRLIEETGANGVIFITGDTHWAQFSKRTTDVPYALWEVNSSGLTENWEWVPPDKNRLGSYYFEDNYGLIRINWDKEDPEITLEIRAVDNDLVMQNTIRLSELQVQQ